MVTETASIIDGGCHKHTIRFNSLTAIRVRTGTKKLPHRRFPSVGIVRVIRQTTTQLPPQTSSSWCSVCPLRRRFNESPQSDELVAIRSLWSLCEICVKFVWSLHEVCLRFVWSYLIFLFPPKRLTMTVHQKLRDNHLFAPSKSLCETVEKGILMSRTSNHTKRMGFKCHSEKIQTSP